MKRWNAPIALYLFLVFVSGSVVGALAYRTYNPPTARSSAPPKLSPEEFRRQYLEEMRTRVGMSPDQVKKLDEILDETRSRFRESRDKHDQEIKTIREEQFAKVRAILTPEQLPKYEQVRSERDQRMRQQQQQNKR